MQFDDVGVADLFKYGNLSIGPLGICIVLECFEDFLEGEALLFVLEGGDLPDMAVGS
jgi:hypothetical protein